MSHTRLPYATNMLGTFLVSTYECINFWRVYGLPSSKQINNVVLVMKKLLM